MLLKRLISLNNLTRPGVEAGQVATLLILLMIIGLVLVLATVNIGQVAVSSTALSNAADAAALGLASSLATKSRQLCEGLINAGGGCFEYCKKRNLLGAILALVFAIIATIITWGCAWYTILLAAAAAGAVGGMIGAAIMGTDIWQGAMMGGAIGLAVGTIALGVQNVYAAYVGAQGGSGAVSSVSAFLKALGGLKGTMGTLALFNMGGSVLYMTGDAAINYEQRALSQLTKQLAKLDEASQFRETAIFTALSRVVDDPVKVADEHDLDADEDRTEPTSRFLSFWWERIGNYTAISAQWESLINDFVGKMKNFRNVIVPAYNGTPQDVTVYIYTDPMTGEEVVSETPPTGTPFPPPYTTETRTKIVPGMLERQDYKWSLEQVTIDGEQDMQEVAMAGPCVGQGIEDGSIVGLLRPLYALGYTTPYWQPGPSDTPCDRNDPINAWMDIDCSSGDVPSTLPTCSPSDIPAGYDDFDGMTDGLRDMAINIDTIIPPTFDEFMAQYYPNVNLTISDDYSGIFYFNYNWMRAQYEAQYQELVAEMNPVMTWQMWIYDFYNPYDPADPDTYYMILAADIALLENIKNELIAMRESRMPACNEGNYDAAATEPTCINCLAGSGHWEWREEGGSWYLIFIPDCGLCVFNPPCSFRNSTTHSHDTLTIDMDSDDELLPAINDIDRMIAEMTNFRDQIKVFADQMFGLNVNALGDCVPGNHNCVQYIWDDSRGQNTIMVQLGAFRMPYLKKKSSWRKTCMQLKDYTDAERCWVKVTRYDPAPNVGIFGKWNPFRRGISRISKVGYTPGAGEIWDIWIKGTK